MRTLATDSSAIGGTTTTAVEHRLRATLDAIASFTIGVEEEYMLVDPETLQPAACSGEALWGFHGDPRIVSELLQCQIEGISPICVSVAGVVHELAAIRRLLASRLDGLALPVAVGAHPWALDPGPTTDAPRYDRISLAHPLAARKMLVCGLHVHVAVGGAERALAVYNAMRSYLPLIAALAGNAPFHEGEDTKMASVRPTLLRHLPRTGTPPAFQSLSDYAEFLVWARGAGAHDATHHWWDLRLHPSAGTLEVRVADVPTRIEDTGTIAALVQSLVFWLSARYDSGETPEVHPTERIEENARLAARYGTDGLMASLGGGTQVATADILTALFETLESSAHALGCEHELSGVMRLLHEGGGPARQRLVANRAGIEQLVRWLAHETTDNCLPRSRAGRPDIVQLTHADQSPRSSTPIPATGGRSREIPGIG